MSKPNPLAPTERMVEFRNLLVGDVIVTDSGDPDELRELVTGVGARGVSVRDQHGVQRSLSLKHDTKLLVRDTERTDAHALASIAAEESANSGVDADPMPTAFGTLRIVMDGTCSGAGPIIVETCMDPETGALWDREVAELPTTHVETQAARESAAMPGTFNENPDRFELITESEFDPSETFAVASLLLASTDLLAAAERALALIKATWPEEHGQRAVGETWGALEQAITKAKTPYVPTPDPSRV